MRFEGDTVVEQGWDDGRREKTRVPFGPPGEKKSAILFVETQNASVGRERLPMEEHEPLFM